MLRARLVEIAGGGDFQTKEIAEAGGEIANLVGVHAAQVITEEDLEKMEGLRTQEELIEDLKEDLEFEETIEAFENEKSKPKVPRRKASSDKRVKGPSSQRKGYG